MTTNNHDTKINVRRKAVELLQTVESEGAYADILLANLIRLYRISDKDRRLLTEVLYGTLRNKLRLDSLIYGCVKKKKKIDRYALNTLRISVYQLIFLDRVPDFAIINEAVKIIKSSKVRALSGFVNAILRKIAKNKAAFLETPDLKSPAAISLFFSCPKWLVKYFIRKWGTADTVKFLENSMTAPKLVVRRMANVDPIEFENSLVADAVIFEQHEFPGDIYTITPPTTIDRLESFKMGWFIVQSAASSLITRLLDLQSGDTVLDLCSAPGTKSIDISSRIGAGGNVVACDLYPHRLRRVNENIARFGLKNVLPLACDASKPLPLKESFRADKILLDAPCSGLGTLRKTPEIKYRVSKEKINGLADLQLSLLQNAARYLKDGGKLVYSTCSVTDEENEGVIKIFLENNTDFVLEEINDTDLINNRMVDSRGFFRTLPHIHLTDGFFAAVLTKKS